MSRLALMFVFLAALWLPGPARAEQAGEVLAAAWMRDFDAIEAAVAAGTLTPRGIAAARARVLAAELAAGRLQSEAEAQLAAVETLLAALGPAPAEGEPAEAVTVGQQRQVYLLARRDIRARTARAALAIARAGQIDATLFSLTQQNLLSQLTQRSPYALSTAIVTEAAPEYLAVLASLLRSPLDWWLALPLERRHLTQFLWLLIVAPLSLVIGAAIRRSLRRYLGYDAGLAEPSYVRRVIAAVAQGLERGLVPVIVLVAILSTLLALVEIGVQGSLFAPVIENAGLAVVIFLLLSELPRAALAPDAPNWRLFYLPLESVQGLIRAIRFLAAVIAIETFFQGVITAAPAATLRIAAHHDLIFRLVEAVALIVLVRPKLWRTEAEAGEESRAENRGIRLWTVGRGLIALASIGAIVAMVTGYIPLGAYFVKSTIASIATVAALLMARGVSRELLGAVFRSDFLRAKMQMRHGSRNLLRMWARLALDLVLIVAGFLFILWFWGLPSEELTRWLHGFRTGFTLGNVEIVPIDVGMGLVIFLGVMALTRLLQRSLRQGLFPATHIDIGLQNSINAGIGYLGVIFAVILAFVAVGFDPSSLAIVAGALSLGIGFGLQSMANNFISGLILLIERPVKVGDWIVVGDEEGIVKRINVRSTELETFQRASLIIPNGEFISGIVKNLTLKDRLARIDLPVGVEYGADVEQVRRLLLEAASRHPDISDDPPPKALLRGFGESSLDFELRCHTPDVMNFHDISSDLRFEIVRLFREHGIVIPFPQRVLHRAEDEKAPQPD